uniref:Uncharacterized protein n=1 Tax=Ascaris lumbricoides TaxID=6252 RepID=A0A9J2PAJ8_ASCLU
MTDRRHLTLRSLLVAYSVYTASSYSQRATLEEYGINAAATELQHALHDEMLLKKHENRQESRANGNIVYGHSNVSGSHSSRDYSVLTRMRQPREAISELESQDYDSNDLKHISAKYQILATLDVAPSSIEDDTEMARRWRAAINEAFFQSRARHFRQKGIPFKDITSRNGTASTENTFGDKEPELNIQILGTECSADGCVQSFAVVYNGQLVPAEVIASDLSLLSLSHISAHLMLPVRQISMAIKRGHDNESQWWIIAIVVGGGIAIIMCGWLILFVYYNTCGRPYRPTEESSLVKKVYLKDELAQTEMEATASETTDDGQNSYESKHRSSSIHEEGFSDVQLPPATLIEHQR